MTKHNVVSREQWTDARRALLADEKRLTHEREALARRRRELPWVKVEKSYTFDTPAGKKTLADLFKGRSQLLIYHFMFGPDWKEGCPSCSFVCDHINGAVPHLAARDVTLMMISRAPLPKIQAFKQRMGWQFPWVSSFGTDFNVDYHVSFSPEQKARGKVDYNYEMAEFPSDEAPGASVFYRDPSTGEIFHTYSVYARGLDPLVGTYQLLDMVPKGRDEDGLPFTMAWLRHHDRYESGVLADADRPYWPEVMSETAATAMAGSSSCCHGAQKTTAERDRERAARSILLPHERTRNAAATQRRSARVGSARSNSCGAPEMPRVRRRLRRAVHRDGRVCFIRNIPADGNDRRVCGVPTVPCCEIGDPSPPRVTNVNLNLGGFS